MANITQTLVNDSTPTIVARNALSTLKQMAPLMGMVNRDYDIEIAEYGDTVNVSKRGTLAAQDKAANSTVTLQAPADDKVSVTLNKHKEVSFLIEDVAKAFARPDVLAGYAADAVDRLVEAIDTDIAALFSGFTSIGSGASTMNRTLITTARKTLTTALAPSLPRNAVIGPAAEQALLDSDTFTFANYVGDPEAFRMGTLGKAFGFMFDMDTNLPNTGASPDGERNFFFHRDAITLVTRPLAAASMPNLGVFQSVVNVNGVALRSTISYNPNYLGLQVTLDVLYGVAVLRPEYGVQVITAA